MLQHLSTSRVTRRRKNKIGRGIASLSRKRRRLTSESYVTLVPTSNTRSIVASIPRKERIPSGKSHNRVSGSRHSAGEVWAAMSVSACRTRAATVEPCPSTPEHLLLLLLLLRANDGSSSIVTRLTISSPTDLSFLALIKRGREGKYPLTREEQGCNGRCRIEGDIYIEFREHGIGGASWRHRGREERLRNRVLLLLDGGKRAHVTIMRPA